MKAILVLAGLTLIAYGVIVLLITFGFATQVDPNLKGTAWRAAVLARLFGNLIVGLVLSALGLVGGIGLTLWARFGQGGGPPE